VPLRTKGVPPMKRTPLVSLGQGDYRRDYHGADEFRSLPLWYLAIGLALGAVAAIAIDQLNQPSGVRTNDIHTPAQTASSGALGS
jgi:hypothetical protein